MKQNRNLQDEIKLINEFQQTENEWQIARSIPWS